MFLRFPGHVLCTTIHSEAYLLNIGPHMFFGLKNQILQYHIIAIFVNLQFLRRHLQLFQSKIGAIS